MSIKKSHQILTTLHLHNEILNKTVNKNHKTVCQSLTMLVRILAAGFFNKHATIKDPE